MPLVRVDRASVDSSVLVSAGNSCKDILTLIVAVATMAGIRCWIVVCCVMAAAREAESLSLGDAEEATARRWLARHNEALMAVRFEATLADWNYATNITEDNQHHKVSLPLRNNASNLGIQSFCLVMYNVYFISIFYICLPCSILLYI